MPTMLGKRSEMLKARATTGPVSWKRWKGPLGAGIESHSNGHHHHHNHHHQQQQHHSPHNHHSGGGSSGGGGVLQNGRTGGGGIRVGSAFQATIPEFSPVMPRERTRDRDRDDVPVWSPHHSIPEEQLDEYLSVAKEVHGYSTEQALGLLLWHAHNIERSLADMPNFAPDADEWGETERALFEQAYGFHGKSFHLIQQMLPGKSIGSLVRHYYTWKQTRTRTSVMDREERRQANRRAQLHSDEELDGAQEEEDEEDNASDSDYHPYKKMKREEHRRRSRAGRSRAVQRRDGPPASPPPRHRAHRAHHHHHHHSGRDRRHPPRHMYLEQSDLQVVVAACCPPATDSRPACGDARPGEAGGGATAVGAGAAVAAVAAVGAGGASSSLTVRLDTQIVDLKKQAQKMKQHNSSLKQKLKDGVSAYRPQVSGAKAAGFLTSSRR
ncbi:uncharacterized protein LOC144719958 [Lampetra planeri]